MFRWSGCLSPVSSVAFELLRHQIPQARFQMKCKTKPLHKYHPSVQELPGVRGVQGGSKPYLIEISTLHLDNLYVRTVNGGQLQPLPHIDLSQTRCLLISRDQASPREPQLDPNVHGTRGLPRLSYSFPQQLCGCQDAIGSLQDKVAGSQAAQHSWAISAGFLHTRSASSVLPGAHLHSNPFLSWRLLVWLQLY